MHQASPENSAMRQKQGPRWRGRVAFLSLCKFERYGGSMV